MISRYGASLTMKMSWPYSVCLSRRMPARRSSVAAEYAAPDGLFGVLISTTATFGLSARSNASKSIWNAVVSGGTTVSVAPVPSTYGMYSGKNGANVSTSSPGLVTARNACASEPVAPDVGKMCCSV